MKTIFVTYEDRLEAFEGLPLLLYSINKESPNSKFLVFTPLENLRSKINLDSVFIKKTEDLKERGWNVKPEILLRSLEEYDRAVWLDTDILVTGDISVFIDKFDKNTFVVGQDFRMNGLVGGELRARAFSLSPVRNLDYAVNSGVIIATKRHLSLLQSWKKVLNDPEYVDMQKKSVSQRNIFKFGDQDALWAVLVSDFAYDIEVEFFRTGIDQILHCGANGFHVLDRVKLIFREKPKFIHMLGPFKPWSFNSYNNSKIKNKMYFHQVCFELSPYFEFASLYRKDIGNPEWLSRRTRLARFFNFMFLGNWALQGLPIAAIAWLTESLRIFRVRSK